MTYRVAVLGLGVMGQRMLGHLALHEQFEILGGWDASADARAHAGTLHPTVDFEMPADALIRSDRTDLVYIGVPPKAHAGYALAAIEARKAVLCEKPLGVDVASSRALTERMEASGLPQAVNFAYGSSRAGDVIRDAYRSGEFGTLVGVDIRQHFAVWPRPWQASAKWLALREEGGFVREVLSHFLYLCDRVLGPARLESFDVRHPADPSLCETHASARLSAAGVPVTVASSSGGVGPDLVEITFWGTKKSHRITDWYRTEETTGGPWIETTPVVDDYRRDGAFRQLNQIIAMIEGKPHSLPDFRAALRVQELIEAMLA
ncbi:MAG: oxidoreductase [Rhodospirillales bacterium]|nr:oxidoreductase [Rhodospirillales bacterium]